MKLWKTWFDLRLRFYLCAVLITLIVVPPMLESALHARWQAEQAEAAAPPQSGEMESSDTEESPEATNPYLTEIEVYVHGHEHIIFAILAVVLGVGGTMTQGQARSNLMTLSLPPRRREWLVAQWLTVAGLVTLLCLLTVTLIAVIGLVAGISVPLGALVVAALVNALAAIVWVWPSILSTSLTKDAVRAALLVVTVIIVLQTIGWMFPLDAWRFNNIADQRQWIGSVPWKPLIVAIAMSGACALLVIRRFRQTDY